MGDLGSKLNSDVGPFQALRMRMTSLQTHLIGMGSSWYDASMLRKYPRSILAPLVWITLAATPCLTLAANIDKAPSSQEDIDSLLIVARSSKTDERENALRELANPDPKAQVELNGAYLKLLDQKDLKIRDAAVEACGNMGYKESIPKIRTILKTLPRHPVNPQEGLSRDIYDENEHAVAAGMALAKMNDVASVPEMLSRQALALSWPAVLPKFGGQVVSLVAMKAKDKNVTVRFYALRTIESMNSEEALPQVQALIFDKDPEIRHSAITAITRMKSPGALGSVEGIYGRLDDHDRASFVEACFSQCETNKALDYSKRFMRESKDIPMKTDVIRAIGTTKRQEVVPYLESLLTDQNDSVREQAACQLARITGKKYEYAETNWSRLLEKDCIHIKKLTAK